MIEKATDNRAIPPAGWRSHVTCLQFRLRELYTTKAKDDVTNRALPSKAIAAPIKR